MSIKKRHFFATTFKITGLLSIVISLSFLVILISALAINGYNVLKRAEITLDVLFEKNLVTQDNYNLILNKAIYKIAENTEQEELITEILSEAAEDILSLMVKNNKELIDQTFTVKLPLKNDIDSAIQHNKIPEKYQNIVALLRHKNLLDINFNSALFLNTDSTEPENAGLAGAIVGSLYTMFICMLVAFPLGVATAVYLEEFAKKNTFTTLIEININNLASVPSIVYGLLGLAIFLNFFELPRSSSISGGLTLGIMITPIIVVTSRNALKAVPKSIKEAVRALGATNMQILFHHTLPVALPGILTGSILGLSRAIGETAPLIMIGMVAFISDIPSSFLDSTSVLPVQIYLWANNPNSAFTDRTAAAILVLLAILIMLNISAIILRKKYEKKF